jgi:hypothetical protein
MKKLIAMLVITSITGAVFAQQAGPSQTLPAKPATTVARADKDKDAKDKKKHHRHHHEHKKAAVTK